MTTLRNQMLSATAHLALHNAMESNRRARPPAPKHSYVFSRQEGKQAIACIIENKHGYVDALDMGILELFPTREET